MNRDTHDEVQFVLEQLLDEISTMVNECSVKSDQYQSNGQDSLFYQYCGKGMGMLDISQLIINKKREIRQQYREGVK